MPRFWDPEQKSGPCWPAESGGVEKWLFGFISPWSAAVQGRGMVQKGADPAGLGTRDAPGPGWSGACSPFGFSGKSASLAVLQAWVWVLALPQSRGSP